MLLQSKEYVILASSRRPFATQYKIRCSFPSFVTREFKTRGLRTTTTDKHATAHDQNHVTVRFSRVVLRLRWGAVSRSRDYGNLRSGVIYLTSSQPPPNLHDLPFAWPVMFLANKRLPWSVLGEKKFLSTSVFRWRFVKNKKKLMCCFCDEILLAGAVVPLWIATNNKEFTG